MTEIRWQGGVVVSAELMQDADLARDVMDQVMTSWYDAITIGPMHGPGRAEQRAANPIRIPLTEHAILLAEGEADLLTTRCDRCGHLDALHHSDDGMAWCGVDECECDH